MSQKKDTKATPKKSCAELRRQLARDIAAIFANPETPTAIHNGLGEVLNDYFNDLPPKQSRIDESEAYINLLLEAGEEARKEGTHK